LHGRFNYGKILNNPDLANFKTGVICGMGVYTARTMIKLIL